MTSHARHAMRMGWSEASLSTGDREGVGGGTSSFGREGGRRGGREEAAGRYEGEEAIFI